MPSALRAAYKTGVQNRSRQLLLRCSNYGRPALTDDFVEPPRTTDLFHVKEAL